jgi:HEPN domain-containing protein
MVRGVFLEGRWRASIAVPAELLPKLRDAAPDWMPPDCYAFVTEINSDGSDGQTTLDFEIESSGHDPRELAEKAWMQLLRKAAVEGMAPSFVGFLPPTWDDPRHERLRREAAEFFAEERYDLAVVRAQTACEVLALTAIAGALRGAIGRERGDRLSKTMRPALSDKATQEILAALTGSHPRKTSWWEAYSVHRSRRNHIVHGGQQVTRAEAEESLEAVDQCMAWLKDIWSGRISVGADA